MQSHPAAVCGATLSFEFLTLNVSLARDDIADERVARTLTLLAKGVQAVGNLGSTFAQGKVSSLSQPVNAGSLSRCASHWHCPSFLLLRAQETFMDALKPVVLANVRPVKSFLDKLCAEEGDTSGK